MRRTEKYAAVIYPVKYFLCLMILFSSSFYIPYLIDMAAFNLTGQGMKRNAADGLFTKPSKLGLTEREKGVKFALILSKGA
ncbi:MAG: hypothetical protein ACYTEW_25565 [Planctomycetota bacterium]|jgi:hypothetical protein